MALSEFLDSIINEKTICTICGKERPTVAYFYTPMGWICADCTNTKFAEPERVLESIRNIQEAICSDQALIIK